MPAAHNTTKPARAQRLALRTSALVELATGLALLAVPTVVFDVLIGSPSDSGRRWWHGYWRCPRRAWRGRLDGRSDT